ncbi:putative virion structural protein [Erwinia phage vB_EamM_Asesino]|uniref:Virion structural protein n=1 Tax=Erwinia phage vB_EamM_Asesino TaxID=1883370 RepID=A0A1B2IA81_9CAUD|nr:putative virion structural protein [Erwinia phage vB_EamM_Asesino]ANZ48183.1 putative virion structural protein [Erwinia phage vB_EamM_Asesino]
MGITINWDDQTDQQLDAIEVYRSDAVINPNNPGTPLATLPGTARSYEDTTVKVGNTYFYTVAVVKGGNRSFGASQSQGYFSNLGPGPQRVIRGDWVRGYFGEIMNVDWVSPVDVVTKIKAALKSTAGLTFVTSSDRWHKFIYKGKIFFAPSTRMIYSTYQNAYNAGFLFGEDGVGHLPTGDAGTVNQKTVIEINGYQFLVRPIRMTDKPTTQYLTSADDFLNGEWKSTFARLRLDANAMVDPTVLPRFSDYSSIDYCGGPHLADANNCATANSGNPELLATTVKTSNINWCIVLELLP